jgi:VIT1/CCC1 family predicted Fe2+/Mn2+ transporter
MLFGFLDGFFFSFFLMLMMLVFVVYRLGRIAMGNPAKAVSWAKTLHTILHGIGG